MTTQDAVEEPRQRRWNIPGTNLVAAVPCTALTVGMNRGSFEILPALEQEHSLTT